MLAEEFQENNYRHIEKEVRPGRGKTFKKISHRIKDLSEDEVQWGFGNRKFVSYVWVFLFCK